VRFVLAESGIGVMPDPATVRRSTSRVDDEVQEKSVNPVDAS
jgi:hypothetical protein